jgi:hypothetical protein
MLKSDYSQDSESSFNTLSPGSSGDSGCGHMPCQALSREAQDVPYPNYNFCEISWFAGVSYRSQDVNVLLATGLAWQCPQMVVAV